jgi:hydroxymethylpyrimidine pyrophosphatase-like HAD family hydrolase
MHFTLDNYLQDQYFLEVSHPLANKKNGALQWAELVGCLPEQMIVFGDNLNDIGLFEAGTKNIAVSNARAELKEKTGLIIASNEEDGVARYIKSLL